MSKAFERPACEQSARERGMRAAIAPDLAAHLRRPDFVDTVDPNSSRCPHRIRLRLLVGSSSEEPADTTSRSLSSTDCALVSLRPVRT